MNQKNKADSIHRLNLYRVMLNKGKQETSRRNTE